MATAVVKAVYGTLVIAPTSAASGGTAIGGVDVTKPILVIVPAGSEEEVHGLERDAVRMVAVTRPEHPTIEVPAQGGDVDTLKLLFAAITSDGVSMFSHGAQAVVGGHKMREAAAVIRPFSASEAYWYFPRLALDTEARPAMGRHRTEKQLAQSSLVLACGRPDNSAYPAVGWGSAAAIDAAYGLGAVP